MLTSIPFYINHRHSYSCHISQVFPKVSQETFTTSFTTRNFFFAKLFDQYIFFLT